MAIEPIIEDALHVYARRYFGEAYSIVKTCYDNLSYIQIVSDDVANVNTVAENIADVDTLVDNLANVNTVADDIANVNNVGSNIADVVTVADNIPSIDAALANMTNIDTVATGIGNVNTVAGNIADVNTTADNIAAINAAAANGNIDIIAADIANINTVATDIGNVNSVAGDLANIAAAVANQTDIDTVATNIGSVNGVSGSIANINTVSGNIPNINTVAGISTGVNTVAANVGNISAILPDIGTINTVAGDLADINTVAANTADIDTVVANIVDIQNAEENAAAAVTAQGLAEDAEAGALAAANATAYNPVTTYNFPDAVIGSNGFTYRCIGTSVLGDNPVGSSSGDWKQLNGLEFRENLLLNTFFQVNQDGYSSSPLVLNEYGHDWWKSLSASTNYASSSMSGQMSLSYGSIGQRNPKMIAAEGEDVVLSVSSGSITIGASAGASVRTITPGNSYTWQLAGGFLEITAADAVRGMNLQRGTESTKYQIPDSSLEYLWAMRYYQKIVLDSSFRIPVIGLNSSSQFFGTIPMLDSRFVGSGAPIVSLVGTNISGYTITSVDVDYIGAAPMRIPILAVSITTSVAPADGQSGLFTVTSGSIILNSRL